jgi:hypothetical protein
MYVGIISLCRGWPNSLLDVVLPLFCWSQLWMSFTHVLSILVYGCDVLILSIRLDSVGRLLIGFSWAKYAIFEPCVELDLLYFIRTI